MRVSPLPPAERREAIVNAVLPLLMERGPAVTSRELASAAGVAEGTIWKAFAGKEELLAAALERAIDPTAFEATVAAIDPALPFRERLTLATELMQRRMVGIWRLLTQIDPSGRRHTPQRLPDNPAMVQLFRSEADHIRIPAAEAARRHRALVLALSNEALVDPPLTAAEIVDTFLEGVGAHR